MSVQPIGQLVGKLFSNETITSVKIVGEVLPRTFMSTTSFR